MLLKHLPEYQWHFLVRPDCQASIDDATQDPFLLGPDAFGWPVSRPRMYSIGILKDGKCTFTLPEGGSAYSRIQRLFSPCSLDSRSLFVAPKAPRLQCCVEVKLSTAFHYA